MRRLLSFLVILVAAMAVVYAGGQTEAPAEGSAEQAVEQEGSNAARSGQYGEAPMLREMVDAGELPPIEERLPVRPKVVEPIDSVGQYGGTLSRPMFSGAGGFGNLVHEALLQFQWNLSKETVGVAGVEPNIVEEISFSDGFSTVTLKIREGLKWSDGDLYTTEDVAFQWNDVWMDDNVPEDINGELVLAGEIPEFTVVDDYVFTLSWSKAFPAAEKVLAWIPGEFNMPAHILKQYHPRYNSDIDSYDELIQKIGGAGTEVPMNFASPELPTIEPWDVISYTPGQRAEAVRNPYYHVVDTQGNQLPYIDRVVLVSVPDSDVAALRVINGEFDLASSPQLSIKDVTLLAENQEKGGYTLHAIPEGRGKAIYLNHFTGNDRIRELFTNRGFRIALSVAIDRNAVNRLVYNGLAEPIPYTYNPYSPYFSEEFGMGYSYFDPDEANEILDDIGLMDTDGDGIREFSNGDPVELLAIQAIEQTDMIDTMELVKSMWEDVGISLSIQALKKSIAFPKLKQYDQHDVVMWNMGGATEPLLRGDRYAPVGSGGGKYWTGPAYEWYVSGGERGEEPTGLIARTLELYTAAVTGTDSETVADLMHELGKLHVEEVLNIGVVTPPVPLIYSNRLQNTRPYVYEHTYKGMDIVKPAQFYFAD